MAERSRAKQEQTPFGRTWVLHHHVQRFPGGKKSLLVADAVERNAMGTETNGLAGFLVLSLESRRASEMAKLIENYGGKAIVVRSMREVPLASNMEARQFAQRLAAREFEVVIFLTGVGTRELVRVAESVYPRERFIEELRRVTIVARGPKPLAALKELGVPVAVSVPEPNTWREILASLDRQKIALHERGVAVQEYGAPTTELLAGLLERGARVMQVPVYRWALPEDMAELAGAVERIANGGVDLLLFTSSVQVDHLLQVAKQTKAQERLRAGLANLVIGSIGPMTSERLREHGIHVDFEPEHPKMGYLVNEAARRMQDKNFRAG